MKTKTDPEMAKTTFRLPATLWKRVQHHSIDSGLTLMEIVQNALEQYLDKTAPRKRKADRP
jgi:predicted DNA-binding protein